MLPYLLAAILGAGGPQGVITLKSGGLELTLDSAACHTIVSIKHEGTRLTYNAGGQGAVINAGDWLGGAMKSGGEEQVLDLAITVDGQAVALAPPQTIEGGQITVTKSSMLASIKHTAETKLQDGVMVQTHSFEFTEEMTLKSFYAFIYSFVPEMTHWMAEDSGGGVSGGECKGEGAHPFSRAAKWFALYNAAAGKGVVVHYQTPIASTTTIWDHANYRKYFVQPMNGTVAAGTRVSYTIVLKAFSAPVGDWQQAARTAAAELAAAYPPAAAQTPAQPNVLYGEGVPEQGLMTVKTANFDVVFQAESAWTIDEIRYQGTVVAGATGHYGTVLIPAGGNFIGTGHSEGGREIVHSLTMTVDGVETPVKVGGQVSGHEIVLTKRSTIHKFDATHTITVTDDYITERATLRATEPHELKLMYLFMHCWEPSTTKWIAELADGSIAEGEFAGDKSFKLNADARWVAQYMPEPGLGLVQYMPEIATGPGSATRIWDQPHYHKCYIQTNTARSLAADEVLDYLMVVRIVPGEDGTWTATKAAVEELKRQWPPVEGEG